MSISANVKRVEEMVREAALKARRDPAEITLVAVSKTAGIQEIQEAFACGLRDFAENRVQDGLEKVASCPPGITWHFIGHLQTNKVKFVLPNFALIHSLDRFKLAEKINQVAEREGKEVQALVQVNIAAEDRKHGLPPKEAEEFIRDLRTLPFLKVTGLMAMAPFTADPEEARPYFRGMKALYDSIRIPGVHLQYLSMGMSGDFYVAVEEGANIVRIGSLIFQSGIND